MLGGTGAFEGALEEALDLAAMGGDHPAQLVPQRLPLGLTGADAEVGADVIEHQAEGAVSDHGGDFGVGGHAREQGGVVGPIGQFRPAGWAIFARSGGPGGAFGAVDANGVGDHALFQRFGEAEAAPEAGDDHGQVEGSEAVAGILNVRCAELPGLDGGEAFLADFDQQPDGGEQPCGEGRGPGRRRSGRLPWRCGVFGRVGGCLVAHERIMNTRARFVKAYSIMGCAMAPI